MKQTDRNGFGATPRRKYDETFKRHAVDLTLHGDRTVKTVAKELGIPDWALYEWRKLYAPLPGDSGVAPQTLEQPVFRSSLHTNNQNGVQLELEPKGTKSEEPKSRADRFIRVQVTSVAIRTGAFNLEDGFVEGTLRRGEAIAIKLPGHRFSARIDPAHARPTLTIEVHRQFFDALRLNDSDWVEFRDEGDGYWTASRSSR